MLILKLLAVCTTFTPTNGHIHFLNGEWLGSNGAFNNLGLLYLYYYNLSYKLTYILVVND